MFEFSSKNFSSGSIVGIVGWLSGFSVEFMSDRSTKNNYVL
jgi:hypothetical protein